jgi:hypothetical protein
MPAVILYGPPAAGKGTVTKALTRLDNSYWLYQSLKVGPGRTAGYRMAALSHEADISINTADMQPVDTATTIYGRVHARLGTSLGAPSTDRPFSARELTEPSRSVRYSVRPNRGNHYTPKIYEKLPHYLGAPPKNLTE